MATQSSDLKSSTNRKAHRQIAGAPGILSHELFCFSIFAELGVYSPEKRDLVTDLCGSFGVISSNLYRPFALGRPGQRLLERGAMKQLTATLGLSLVYGVAGAQDTAAGT